MSGFGLRSNTTAFMHSEVMADFGGTLALHRDSDGSLRVTNGTEHPLENCQILRIDDSGGGEIAAIAGLTPGETHALEFKSFHRDPALLAPYRTEPQHSSGNLNVAGVEAAALNVQDMRPGEVCLVAHVTDDVPGLTIAPAVPQSRQETLLVAHLDAGRLPEPKADVSTSSNQPSEEEKPESTEGN